MAWLQPFAWTFLQIGVSGINLGTRSPTRVLLPLRAGPLPHGVPPPHGGGGPHRGTPIYLRFHTTIIEAPPWTVNAGASLFFDPPPHRGPRSTVGAWFVSVTWAW